MKSENSSLIDADFFYTGVFRKPDGQVLEVGYSGMCRCPSPQHSDNNPSAKAYDGGVYCFVCGKFYGIPYIAKVVGYSLEGREYVKPASADKAKEVDRVPLFFLLW